MISSAYYPLRSIVGPSIPILSVVLHSAVPKGYTVVAIPDDRIGGYPSQTLYDKVTIQLPDIGNIYERFLPIITTDTGEYTPAPGMATMPLADNAVPGSAFFPFLHFLDSPPDLPFSPQDPVASLFGFKMASFARAGLFLHKPNRLSAPLFSNTLPAFVFAVTLERPALIGGICFQGYPYIASRVESSTGMTLGNFGLPREIRLVPLPAQENKGQMLSTMGYERSQFLDSEFAYVRQQIASHSGINYLTIDPVVTNRFLLTITDLPFIITAIDLSAPSEPNGGRRLGLRGFAGFAMPYLYCFEYREGTKKPARMHTGVLGVISDARPSRREGQRVQQAFPEYEFSAAEGQYALFTAHSCVGQRRAFPDNEKPRDQTLQEMFISDLLRRDDRVVLFLQQGEEYDRCIAGLRMLFPMLPDDAATQRMAEQLLALAGGDVVVNQHLSSSERQAAEELLARLLALPSTVNFCERVRIRIFELDPIEGASPLSLDLTSKYVTLLADTVVEDFETLLYDYFTHGIPFRKTSSSKYFAVELTNVGDSAGQIVLHSIHLVRSAHVSIQPRPAKTQRIRALHYRIIGEHLADDFAELGSGGFNFTVDRVVAGQTKSVLYAATSLLDLLHTGGARLHGNVRRRSIEEEILLTSGGAQDNYEQRTNGLRSGGWRATETGHDVVGDPAWAFAAPGPFRAFSNQEARTHTEVLSPQEDVPEWRSSAFIANALHFAFEMGSGFMDGVQNLSNNPAHLENVFLGANQDLIPTYNTVKLFVGFEDQWRGLVSSGNARALRVKGMRTVSSSPFGLTDVGKNIFEMLDALRGNDLTGLTMNFFDIFLNPAILDPRLFLALNCINSLGLSVSLEPLGLGATFSATGSGGQLLPTTAFSNSFGTQGAISKQATKTGYSFSQYRNDSYDKTTTETRIDQSRSRRIITRREVPGTDAERVRGAEVLWQGKVQDILTGSIPLDITWPAIASKATFRTADEALRVRFNSGFPTSVQVDFWFEVVAEFVKDDY